MDLTIQFRYRNKDFSGIIYIDSSEYPCFVFVILLDRELINEFGDEITIKTDCEALLPKKDDYPELVALRQAIFDVVRKTPDFITAKNEIERLSSHQKMQR